MSFFSRYQKPIKYIASIIATTIIVSGTIYAVNITSLSQTATTGDVLTSTWVNAVNTNATAAGAWYSDCYVESAGNTTLTCWVGYTTVLGVHTNWEFTHTVYSAMWWTIASGWGNLTKSWYNPQDSSTWQIKLGSTTGDAYAKYLTMLKNDTLVVRARCNNSATNNANEYWCYDSGVDKMPASVQLCCK